jgi:cytoskeleton protein RodZ
MAELKKQAVVERLVRGRREPPPLIPDADPAGVVHLHAESVAVLLQRARLGLDRNLDQVAAALKIRKVYLVAIEEGRFDDLPGATYAVGFVRAYADYLDLDSEEIVQRFRDEVEGLDERLQLVFRTPSPESKVPGGALILISALLVAVAYGGWYYVSSSEENLAALVPEVPEHLQATAVESDTPVPPETATIVEPAGAPEVAATPAVETEPFEAASEDPAIASTEAEAPSPLPDAGPAVQTEPAIATAGMAASDQATEMSTAPAAAAPDEPPAEPVAEAPPVPPVAVVAEASPEPANEVVAEPAPEPVAAGPRLDDLAASVATRPVVGGGSQAAVELPPASVLAANEIPQAPSPEGLLPEAQTREPRIFGVENVSSRIVLRAVLDSWVQVRDEEDTLLLTRVLQPGDSYQVPDRPGLTLLTGNAGGLAIELDGTALPFVGPVGAVRRDIALDPERLRNGTAATP